jgi:hypothetical protein
VPETVRKTRVAQLVATLLAFCIMVTALLYLFLGNTAVAQGWRMRRAAAHQAVIEQTLASDARFAEVKLGVATVTGGASLLIRGRVGSQTDLQALQELVRSTQPPCHIDYRVVVASK